VSASGSVSIGLKRTSSQELTHVGLVLSPRQTARRRLVQVLLPTGALMMGVSMGFLGRAAAHPIAPPPPPDASSEVRLLQQQLDEARSALRLARAHGQELEHQIDALNQRVRDTTVELTFVKKAREGKPP